jgi:hypothetical protein
MEFPVEKSQFDSGHFLAEFDALPKHNCTPVIKMGTKCGVNPLIFNDCPSAGNGIERGAGSALLQDSAKTQRINLVTEGRGSESAMFLCVAAQGAFLGMKCLFVPSS